MRGRAWPLSEGRAALETIRVRLTLWYVALLGVILIAFSAFLYVSLSRNLQEEADRSLGLEAERLIATLDLEDGRPSFGDNSDTLPAGTVAALYDATGRLLLASDARQRLPTAAEPLARAARGQPTLTTISTPDGAGWRTLIRPVIENGQPIVVLQVARGQHDVEVALGQLVALMAIAVPMTLLFAVGGGVFLAGRALDPIDRITRTAAQIGAADLARRLHLGGNDEVGRLAATFDQMLDRLEAAFQRQRQFTADASHELRTPLALIASQIDLALERPRPADAYRAVLASLRDDTTRLSQLLSELLTLARADAGYVTLDAEPLDLATLVEDVVVAMQPLARTAGIALGQRAEESVRVVGDQTRLTQLLVNLIDNGLKYTPVGGSVTVAVGRVDQRAFVSVGDTGEGIPPEHLPHLFERFYRVDTARDRAAGGAGLGLAICRWIAEAHGGDIGVTSHVGQGTIVTVHLPLADRPAS